MGRGGGVSPVRPPSQTAYFVALAGVAVLLLMLCCYFLHYCYTKLNELSEHASLCGGPPTSSAAAPPARDSYPVHTAVRDSATAMAKLCKELPHGARAGDTVFPASASPVAVRVDMTGATAGGGDAGGGDHSEGGDTGEAGEGGTRGGSMSVASGSEAATLSDDTATTNTGAESPPPKDAPCPPPPNATQQ